MFKLRLIGIIFTLALVLSGCGLLAEAPDYEPFPTGAPGANRVMTLEELRDGGSSAGFTQVSLQVDPEIAMLVGSVSTQNLIGYVQQLESFGTRNTFSETERDDFGIGAAGRWIFNEFERVGDGRLQVQFQEYPLNFEGLFAAQRNVLAVLPGENRDAGVLVIMANYDSRVDDWLDGESLAPGADDNASGVAALIEIARLMSARTWDRTVIFAAMTAEEQGTFGARHFVKEMFLNNVTVAAAINNDMIGGRAGIPQYVRLYSIGPDTSNARQLARYIDYIGRLYVPTMPVRMMDGLDREGRWGDHREFVKSGVAAVRLIESEENLDIQNSTADTWSLIDYDYLTRVAQLNLASLANMASAPPPPATTSVVAADQPGAYQVTWSERPQAAGYAIAFRPVTDSTYETAAFHYVSATEAGDATLAGLDPSMQYAVSIASLERNGCIGIFSAETVVGP